MNAILKQPFQNWGWKNTTRPLIIAGPMQRRIGRTGFNYRPSAKRASIEVYRAGMETAYKAKFIRRCRKHWPRLLKLGRKKSG
jgi:hypothetical protein